MYPFFSGFWVVFLTTILVASCSIPPKLYEIRSIPTSVHPEIAGEDWVEDVWRAEIGSGILNPESLSVHDTLAVSFISSREHDRFAVRSVEPIVGLTNIRAQHTADSSVVLLLTIGEGRTSGRLMEPNRLFILHYDEELAQHFWLRVNPEKMDILPEADPLKIP